MTDVHLHLLINHLPLIGSLFALVLGLYGAARRQPAVVRAAFLTLIVSGVGSFAATRTGEGAEDAVEALPGVSEAILHEHEEAADVANSAAIALALLALGVLVWRRREPQIRHTEIRAATTADAEPGEAPVRPDHDDDD